MNKFCMERGASFSFRLNYASNLPLFLQVVYFLDRQIQAGTFGTDDTLPSVRELSQNTDVARPVIGRAYKVLAQKGIVGYEKERGYFVGADCRAFQSNR